MVIRPLDVDALRRSFQSAVPFPHMVIDEFLEPDFAAEVAAAVPSLDAAREQGFTFDFVRERGKIQVSDADLFPDPVRRLHESLSSTEFLSALSTISGIDNLEADPTLAGGGMHVTGPGGRLDVHVDFNYNEEFKLHRRLNILVYLNPEWDPTWGGHVELWDRDVKKCHVRVPPLLNRCVVFETSDISYHGVEPVSPAAPGPRQSFAAYYYTEAAPEGWDGTLHTTIFRTRPGEKLRRYLVIPAERAMHRGRRALHSLRDRLRSGHETS